jgi:gliding motility-associated protein GldC
MHVRQIRQYYKDLEHMVRYELGMPDLWVEIQAERDKLIEEAKAIMLSIWDGKVQETLRIDLWTKDMPVDEMKLFFHQTLVAMADTFQRATQDEKMADTMKDFCDYFAEKLELKK